MTQTPGDYPFYDASQRMLHEMIYAKLAKASAQFTFTLSLSPKRLKPSLHALAD